MKVKFWFLKHHRFTISQNHVTPKQEMNTTQRFLREYIRTELDIIRKNIIDKYQNVYEYQLLTVSCMCNPRFLLLNKTSSKRFHWIGFLSDNHILIDDQVISKQTTSISDNMRSNLWPRMSIKSLREVMDDQTKKSDTIFLDNDSRIWPYHEDR